MGWTGQYNWQKPSDVRKDIERTWRESENWKIFKIASKAFGKRVWLVVEEKKTSRREIVLYLVDKMGDYYGYKDMSEDMGPFYYDCPIHFLESVGAPQTDAATEWRAKVRKYDQRARRSFQVGDTVRIYDKLYTISVAYKRNIYGVTRCKDGKRFKAAGKLMDFENGLDEARSMARGR